MTNLLEIKVLTAIFPIALVLFFILYAFASWGWDGLINRLTRIFDPGPSEHCHKNQNACVVEHNSHEIPSGDLYLDKLIRDERFDEATSYARDLEKIAIEQDDSELEKLYANYNRMISNMHALESRNRIVSSTSDPIRTDVHSIGHPA